MTSAAGRDAKTSARRLAGKIPDWAVAALVFAAMLAYSAYCRPAPSVNEPHYLGKAKHYWQPEWCAGDLFLTSSNPHRLFYQTIGVLTAWMSLPAAAWTGRVIVLGLLAWGWTRLTSRLMPQRWAPFGAICLFLLLQALGNFSGEWLVGGVESKVIAYALALAGTSYMIERRPIPTGACLGGAIGFHPVVGGWCVISIVLAAILRLMAKAWLGARKLEQTEAEAAAAERSVTLKAWLIGGGLFVGCSLAGLIPALQILGSAEPEAVVQADRIQVGTRLAHHLDPTAFPLAAYRYYGLLIVVGWLSRRTAPQTRTWQAFASLVAAAGCIALAGVLIGWGPRPLQEMALADQRVWLLKFYPFRIADLLIPMWVSCSLIQTVYGWSQAEAGSGWRRWAGECVLVSALGAALLLPTPDRNPSRMSDKKEADWLEACAWMRTQSPPDALLYAANEDWAVKWFCHRAEYVNYKDCPQDTAGILEWVRRLRELQAWHRAAFQDGRCSAPDLQALHERTGITHLLVSRLGPLDVPPAYQNDTFRVYETVSQP